MSAPVEGAPGGEGAGPRKLRRAFYAVGALLLALDAVIHRHAEHPWEGAFGFHAAYGFVACVLLVLAAKRLRRVLMRPEDYYGRRRGVRSAERGAAEERAAEEGGA